jgi:hypothetical protein
LGFRVLNPKPPPNACNKRRCSANARGPHVDPTFAPPTRQTAPAQAAQFATAIQDYQSAEYMSSASINLLNTWAPLTCFVLCVFAMLCFPLISYIFHIFGSLNRLNRQNYRKLGLPPRLPLGDNFLISPGAGNFFFIKPRWAAVF